MPSMSPVSSVSLPLRKNHTTHPSTVILIRDFNSSITDLRENIRLKPLRGLILSNLNLSTSHENAILVWKKVTITAVSTPIKSRGRDALKNTSTAFINSPFPPS